MFMVVLRTWKNLTPKDVLAVKGLRTLFELHRRIFIDTLESTVSTSDYTLWTLYRFYFKGNRTNIKLQVYSVTCC
jgi:hypothetical protein